MLQNSINFWQGISSFYIQFFFQYIGLWNLVENRRLVISIFDKFNWGNLFIYFIKYCLLLTWNFSFMWKWEIGIFWCFGKVDTWRVFFWIPTKHWNPISIRSNKLQIIYLEASIPWQPNQSESQIIMQHFMISL